MSEWQQGLFIFLVLAATLTAGVVAHAVVVRLWNPAGANSRWQRVNKARSEARRRGDTAEFSRLNERLRELRDERMLYDDRVLVIPPAVSIVVFSVGIFALIFLSI